MRHTTPVAAELDTVRVARGLSVVVAGIGIAALVGWLRGIPALTSLFLPGPTLKTNGAISLTAAAIANLLLLAGGGRGWSIAGRVVAAIPIVIGALTLSEHVVGWNLHIDELIAREPAGALATVSPNRMGPPASAAGVLLGVALLFAGSGVRRRRLLSEGLALVTCGLAILPLMGYAYGFNRLYGVARYSGIAMITTFAVMMLGVAILAGRPAFATTALVRRGDEVGLLARRLLLAAVLLPFGMGWALARLLGAGIIDGQFAVSMMALLLMVALAVNAWRTGTRLALSIDARAATEQALSESERSLREADAQKSEFLATLSHELRNPLAPIRFALELLQGPPATAERARQTIGRQVHHLTRLIDDLLDLTRISRDKLELHRRPCELRQLVTDAVEAVSGEIRRAGHQLSVELPGGAIWLHADPERVVQMLVNLLNNAARYTDPGGTITLGASSGNDETVTVFVRDTGLGIAAADLPRVFERFVQVGAVRHGGLGIGLALVRGLAELHGGSVEARSAGLGCGSEFRIRLPRADAPALVPADPAPAAPIAARRILVVDDNRDAADMLADVLAAEGHQVKVAYSGEAALREAATFQPDVGLLDIGMTGMDGYSLAARLRAKLRPPVPLLVAITGWGQESDRRRALAAGFDAHLTKPADPAAIAALLAEHPALVAAAARPATVTPPEAE